MTPEEAAQIQDVVNFATAKRGQMARDALQDNALDQFYTERMAAIFQAFLTADTDEKVLFTQREGVALKVLMQTLENWVEQGKMVAEQQQKAQDLTNE